MKLGIFQMNNCEEGRVDEGELCFSRFSSNFAVVIKWKLKSAAAQRGWKPVCVSLNWSKGRKLLTKHCMWELILDHVCVYVCVSLWGCCAFFALLLLLRQAPNSVARRSLLIERQLQQQQQLPLLGSSETPLEIETMWPKRIRAHNYISCNVTNK